MKKISFQNIVILIMIIPLLTGCNLNSSKSYDKYALAKELDRKAEEYQKAGALDSAITYYQKSFSELRNTGAHLDSTKDKMFIRGMISIQGALASVYSAKSDTNNAILYALESIKWLYLDTMALVRIQDEEILSANLLKMGDKQREGSEEQRIIYSRAKKYIILLGPQIDFLSPINESYGLTNECRITSNLYKKIGDSSRSDFYYQKYMARLYLKHERDSINNVHKSQ